MSTQTSQLSRVSIARERIEFQPHSFEVIPGDVTDALKHCSAMLNWKFVTIADLEAQVRQAFDMLDNRFVLTANIEMLTNYNSILIMFGLLMSNLEPEVNHGVLKYTYIQRSISSAS